MNARPLLLSGVMVILPALVPPVRGATPLGTAFTYQGQLKVDGVPANGAYDIQFRLFDALTSGHQIGPVVQENGLRIADGLFTVRLDFGAGSFGRDARWLEISVRPPLGLIYVVMSPRQALTPAPYALYALDAPSPPVPDQLWVASGNDIHNTNSGKVGIGTAAPGRKLQIGTSTTPNSEGMIRLASRSGTQGSNRIWDIGVPETDADTTGPGYSFVIDDTNLGTDPEVMVKYGTGNVGIGTVAPAAKLHVEGGADAELGSGGSLVVGAVSGANLAIDSDEIMARNNGARDTLYLNKDGGKVMVSNGSWMEPSMVVFGNGQGKMNAPLQVFNMQSSQGMAAWLLNGSNFATAHVENAGSGEVLWLERSNSSGPFIVAYNEQTATRPFQVDADGRTTVTVLQITGGADLSEQFRVGAAKQQPAPGMVVSIDPEHPGDLVVSSRAYDRAVAGVISGAGGVKPGMMMGQADSIADGDHPVALTGRVWCLCETSNGPIQPGDMLTTSDVAGHAMKVTDYDRAQGAVIGKTMTSLAGGETGLVLVLVNLH